MRATITFIGLTVLFLACTGCGTMGGGSQMENTVYDTHRRVVSLDSSLQGSVTNLNKTAAELAARSDSTDQELRVVRGMLEENQMRLAKLQSRLDALTSTLYRERGLSVPVGMGSDTPSEVRVDGQSPVVVPDAGRTAPGAIPAPMSSASPLTTPAPAPGGAVLEPLTASTASAAPVPVSSGSAEADYQAAQRSFSENDFAQALLQFDAFLRLYPTSEYVSNAQFWKARSLQGLERYGEAIAEYDKLRKQYPTCRYMSHAMHQQAVCHARLGQTAQAIRLMQAVIKEYPISAAAEQAKSDLKKLQGG
ncbi:MAG: tetratricopeptide repeat protein [Nitrospiraceae bacterium]|nr:tetratricopeptide repeat protein [Nitrospiraceae bacterium]